MENRFTIAQHQEVPRTSFTCVWGLPPKSVRLEKDEIHVWCISLAPESFRTQSLYRVLTKEEHARAKRLYFKKCRERFIVSRAMLRIIISQYMRVEPIELKFHYGPYGKPELAGNLNPDVIKFNLSHSGSVFLYGVARRSEIGIDIERIRYESIFDQVSKRFFFPGETAILQTLPPTIRKEAFFRCWTRKEACIKARGGDLLFGLSQFEVSVSLNEPASLLSINGNSPAASVWSLHDLSPGWDFVGALAVEGRDHQIKCYQWPSYMILKGDN